jgi:hypothetical protein
LPLLESMSISSITQSTNVPLSSNTQTLARQLAAAVDGNHDGQISTAEFGSFIMQVLQGSTLGNESMASDAPATAPAADASTPLLGFMPIFKGFDASRATSAAGSLKYDAYNVLQNYDPRDSGSMKKAYAVLNQMHPGRYELDSHDNLMLTGTADGYIGGRPVNRESDWTNREQDWSWDWMAYNSAHPGPNGEGASGLPPV